MLLRHSLSVPWPCKYCIIAGVGLARSKAIAQLLCGSLTSPPFWCELKDPALRSGTNHTTSEDVRRYCSMSLLNQAISWRHSMNLSWFWVPCFASLKILLHWDLGLSLLCRAMMQVPRKQPCGKSAAHGHGARFSDDREWSSSPRVSGLILADKLTYWISSSFCGNNSVHDLIWISGAGQARKISDF